MTEPGPMVEVELTAGALSVGDIVETPQGSLRVVSEPMTVHRGWSLFDDFQLLVGAHVQGGRDVRPRFHVWRPDERLRARRYPDAAGARGDA